MRSDCCETNTNEATQETINQCRALHGKSMLIDHFGSDCLESEEYTLQELVKLALLNLMHTCNGSCDLNFENALKEAQAEFKLELINAGRSQHDYEHS